MLDKVMWMGAGIGATLLYKKYDKDIQKVVKKQKNKMMDTQCGSNQNN